MFKPSQPRAPKGMPTGGQWARTGNPAVLKGKGSGAHGGSKPIGVKRARNTGILHRMIRLGSAGGGNNPPGHIQNPYAAAKIGKFLLKKGRFTGARFAAFNKAKRDLGYLR